jgi:hypothetical protein
MFEEWRIQRTPKQWNPRLKLDFPARVLVGRDGGVGGV